MSREMSFKTLGRGADAFQQWDDCQAVTPFVGNVKRFTFHRGPGIVHWLHWCRLDGAKFFPWRGAGHLAIAMNTYRSVSYVDSLANSHQCKPWWPSEHARSATLPPIGLVHS